MSGTAPRDNDQDDGDGDDEGDRWVTNIVVALLAVAIVAIGIWLVNALLEQRRLDDCAAQGRRNCVPLSVPAAR